MDEKKTYTMPNMDGIIPSKSEYERIMRVVEAYEAQQSNKHPGVQVGDIFVMDGEERIVIATKTSDTNQP